MLKDDLIVRLDQFSSEMVILREEIKSLQTVKACLQLRISELEEEAKKTKEDLAQKTKKQEEDDVSFVSKICIHAHLVATTTKKTKQTRLLFLFYRCLHEILFVANRIFLFNKIKLIF